MKCPKHGTEMVQLFTSSVCDLCDPPKVQPEFAEMLQSLGSGRATVVPAPPSYFNPISTVHGAVVRVKTKCGTAMAHLNDVTLERVFSSDEASLFMGYCGVPVVAPHQRLLVLGAAVGAECRLRHHAADDEVLVSDNPGSWMETVILHP